MLPFVAVIVTADCGAKVFHAAETGALMSVLVAEGVAVARALGITLDGDPEKMIDHGREVAYHHKPSMLQDVEAHRATEIDALNAGIARIGRGAGVACPMNEAVAAMIRGLEHSWTLA